MKIHKKIAEIFDVEILAADFLRRRRCFENAKPRRSAGGAQLNRSLGELEGPIRDLDLARFPRVAAFSSAESGSGEPPDRAQICALMCDPVSNCFFF